MRSRDLDEVCRYAVLGGQGQVYCVRREVQQFVHSL